MDAMAKKRFRPVPLAAFSLACLFGSMVLPGHAWGTTPAGPSKPAGQMLKAALASAAKKGSVRVTVHFFSGKTTGEVVQDSARNTGVETVAIGKERISIVLAGGTAYFSANAPGLRSYFGYSTAIASALAGKWISVVPNDSTYRSLIAGLTLPAALKEVSPSGAISAGKTRMLGRQLTASIVGTASAGLPRTTLFVTVHGSHLPVEAVGSSTGGGQATGEIVTFSRWGEAVHVPVPPTPLPLSSLPLGASSGG
jgi:hypothetical protein